MGETSGTRVRQGGHGWDKQELECYKWDSSETRGAWVGQVRQGWDKGDTSETKVAWVGQVGHCWDKGDTNGTKRTRVGQVGHEIDKGDVGGTSGTGVSLDPLGPTGLTGVPNNWNTGGRRKTQVRKGGYGWESGQVGHERDNGDMGRDICGTRMGHE